MLKDILIPVAAALLASFATWFAVSSVDFSSKLQREKIATKIMNDDEFKKIVARDIIGKDDFLKTLKSDGDFRGDKGLDGSSPSAESVAETLRTDDEFRQKLISKSKWPHAINCGSDWSTMLVQHAFPMSQTLTVNCSSWYAQVYPDNYRFVRFKADMTYHDKGGDSPATIAGCTGKSISQLREEGRTFSFFAD